MSKTSSRILVLNNYSFERVWEEVKAGDKPDHHLFGLNYFADAGYEIELAPFHSHSPAQRIQTLLKRCRFPISTGSLGQEAVAWRRRKQVDLIYAPCQTETQLLGYMRHFGLFRVPIVCLAHHPFEKGRLTFLRRPFVRANFCGTDRYPSLSAAVAQEINRLAGKNISEVIPWGPQKNYFATTPGPGHGAVAAGRTGRDFETFGQAATLTGTPAHIICLESTVTPAFAGFGANVTVEAHPDLKPLGYRAMMAALASARVLAVPMFAGPNLAGLTSLTDALALGKPVIMTRNANIDLDIEKLRIGRWVDAGDRSGWSEALRWFDSNPVEALNMGQRARVLVDDGLNSAQFAARMMQLFETAIRENVRSNFTAK